MKSILGQNWSPFLDLQMVQGHRLPMGRMEFFLAQRRHVDVNLDLLWVKISEPQTPTNPKGGGGCGGGGGGGSGARGGGGVGGWPIGQARPRGGLEVSEVVDRPSFFKARQVEFVL